MDNLVDTVHNLLPCHDIALDHTVRLSIPPSWNVEGGGNCPTLALSKYLYNKYSIYWIL